eukprot:2835048-Prymnesium_polylepis.1
MAAILRRPRATRARAARPRPRARRRALLRARAREITYDGRASATRGRATRRRRSATPPASSRGAGDSPPIKECGSPYVSFLIVLCPI